MPAISTRSPAPAHHSHSRIQGLQESAEGAVALLKSMANPDRLMILSTLAEGELCVGDIEQQLSIRQPTLSQQLARLRADKLVATRREGKVIYYRLASGEVERLLDVLYELYCGPLTHARR